MKRRTLVDEYLSTPIRVPGFPQFTASRAIVIAWCQKQGYPDIYIAGVCAPSKECDSPYEIKTLAELEQLWADVDEATQ